MTSPILAAASATSYPATPTDFALPAIDPGGDDVVLYAFISVDTGSLVTVTPDDPDWVLKETNWADGTTTALFRKEVPTAAGPYADSFSTAAGHVWGAVQFAFRSAGGSDPANSNQDTDTYAIPGATNPTSSVTLPGAPTASNLILGFVSIGGYGGPYTGSLTWSYGSGWTEIFDEEVEAIGCAYRVADGTSGEDTFSATRSQNKISSQVTFVVEDVLEAEPTLPAQPGVFLDWDADGFNVGALDNVSSDVRRWTINRGDGPELTGGSQPGSCVLVLKNPSDRYNPENTDSPIHDQLRDGVPLWIGINDQGRLVGGSGTNGMFGGRVTDITPVPAGGAAVAPEVELIAEDALGWYGRTRVQVDEARDRSQADLRLAALVAAGETRYVVPDEPRGLPLSAADGSLLGVLDAINGANGTRHYVKPADSFLDWYAYTARDRMYKVGAAADAALSATDDHVTGMSGWRKTASVVINQQKATVIPISFPDFREIVWQAETLPIIVHSPAPAGSRTIWVTFDDFVDDVEVEITSTTGTTATVTGSGRTAKIELSAPPIHITRLVLTGRKARRGLEQSVVIDDTDSQAEPRGVRSGSEIGGDMVGSLAAARGIATHIVWRFAQPQYRPTLTVENWLPGQFQLDLFDLIAFTSSQLKADARLFEIVGLRHEGILATSGAVYHTVTYTLQECRQQTPKTWFTWDSSDWDGPDPWAYL